MQVNHLLDGLDYFYQLQTGFVYMDTNIQNIDNDQNKSPSCKHVSWKILILLIQKELMFRSKGVFCADPYSDGDILCEVKLP